MKTHLIRRSKFLRPVNYNVVKSSTIASAAPGFLALISQGSCFIRQSQVLSLLRVLKFHFKRKKKDGSFVVNLKLTSDLTRKAIGVRMGKGKGAVDEKIYFMRPGFFILALQDVNLRRGHYIALKCIRRLPVNCKIIKYNSW